MERTTAGRNHCPPRKIDAEAVVGRLGAEDPVDGLRNLEQDAARTGRQGKHTGRHDQIGETERVGDAE